MGVAEIIEVILNKRKSEYIEFAIVSPEDYKSLASTIIDTLSDSDKALLCCIKVDIDRSLQPGTINFR